MNKILKLIGVFILVLAVGISLNNIADLRNNNISLKTDNETLIEQVQGYANMLTLTKAELIVAQNDRDELKQDVVVCENKIIELNAQSVVDKEALVLVENNLATTQQKLAEKEAEIAEFNDIIEKYSIYPMISYSYNGDLKDNILKPAYDIYTRTSTYISDNDSNEWARTSTSNFWENKFCVNLHGSVQSVASKVSLYSKLDSIRGIFKSMFNAGIQVGGLYIYGYANSSSTTAVSFFVKQPFYITDFLELTADGDLSEEDFTFLSNASQDNYPGNLSNFYATRIVVYAYYSDENLDTSNFNFETHTCSSAYYSETLVFNEVDFAPNKLFLGISDQSLYAFNNIYLNVKLDALVIAPIDHGGSYYKVFTSNEMITFSDNFYVDRLYLPNDVKSGPLIDNLQGKYGEIIYLDFSRNALRSMSYPF